MLLDHNFLKFQGSGGMRSPRGHHSTKSMDIVSGIKKDKQQVEVRVK